MHVLGVWEEHGPAKSNCDLLNVPTCSPAVTRCCLFVLLLAYELPQLELKFACVTLEMTMFLFFLEVCVCFCWCVYSVVYSVFLSFPGHGAGIEMRL